MMYMQPIKTIVKEFAYEHWTQHGNKFRIFFDNTRLEFYVFVLYDFLSMQIN